MHQMKTEVVVIRLTKQERAELDAKKTKPILSDWLKELAFAAPITQTIRILKVNLPSGVMILFSTKWACMVYLSQ